MLQPVSVLCSFLGLNNVPLHGDTIFCLCIQLMDFLCFFLPSRIEILKCPQSGPVTLPRTPLRPSHSKPGTCWTDTRRTICSCPSRWGHWASHTSDRGMYDIWRLIFWSLVVRFPKKEEYIVRKLVESSLGNQKRKEKKAKAGWLPLNQLYHGQELS